MAKVSKKTVIDNLIVLIESGKTYSYCLGASGSKWGVPKNTFNRYWKIANQHHTEAQQAIKEAKAALDLQNAIDERKMQIADINERKEILTKILRGEIPLQKAFVVGKSIEFIDVVPDWMDRKAAIAELNKMDGSYAAEKIDLSTDQPATTITLADGTVITL